LEEYGDLLSTQSIEREGAGTATKKAYSPPRLDVLGDVRDITLGSVPGVTDSGGQSAKGGPLGQPFSVPESGPTPEPPPP
jgi:hypothetical protein